MLHPHASPPIDGMSTPRRVSSVATLIDEISEEENQLRAVLAEILSRRPIRDGLTETQALPPTPKPVIGYDLVEPPVGSGEGFAWQSENGDTNTEQSGASADLLSPADDVAVNDHVAGTLIAVTRLAYRTNVDYHVGRIDRVTKIYGFGCDVFGYGMHTGDMRVATEKHTVKTIEDFRHFSVVVNVLRK